MNAGPEVGNFRFHGFLLRGEITTGGSNPGISADFTDECGSEESIRVPPRDARETVPS
jgi:hypothetical protein